MASFRSLYYAPDWSSHATGLHFHSPEHPTLDLGLHYEAAQRIQANALRKSVIVTGWHKSIQRLVTWVRRLMGKGAGSEWG